MDTIVRRNSRKKVGGILFQAFAVAVGLLVLFPIIYCCFVSFMKPNQIQSIPPTFFPREWTL